MRAREWLRRVAVVLIAGVSFVAATVAGLLFHADLPPTRRLTCTIVERLLADTFLGRFSISGIERLSPWVVRVQKVEIFDPNGDLVIRGERLRVRADGFGILREVLFDGEKRTIVLEHVRLERGSVRLLPDKVSGEPTIVQTFAMRGPPSPPSANPIRVWLPSIELGRGELSGRLAFAPKLEAQVDHARGAVFASPVGIAVDAPTFSAKIRGLLPSELRAVGSFHQRGTSHFWSTLDGHMGDLQYDSVLRLDGKRLEATVDFPNARPEAVREFLPDWPLVEPVDVRAKAWGDLPALHAEATATVGRAVVRTEGDIDFGPTPGAKLRARGTGLDLRAFVPGTPETAIDLGANVDIRQTPEGLVVQGDGTTEPTVVSGVPVPGSRFQGRFEKGSVGGTITLFEEGMPLDAKVLVAPGGAIDVDVKAKRFRVERAPRLRELFGAQGDLELSAKARLEKGNLTGTFEADAQGLAFGTFRAGSAHAHGKVRGPLADPKALNVDADVRGKQVVIGPFVLDDAQARVAGPPSALMIEAKLVEQRGASITGKTRLSALGGTRFDGLVLDVTRDGRTLSARAERVDLGAGGLEIRAARVEGAGGALMGSGRLRPGHLELGAQGSGVDLDDMSRILGLGQYLGGKLDIHADVVVARDVQRGTLDLSVADGRLGSLSDITAAATGTLEDESLSAEAHVSVGGLGSARGALAVELSGSPLDTKSYANATGRLDLGLERLDLKEVAGFLPAAIPVAKLSGSVTAQATVLRTDVERRPTVTFLLATERLKFDIERAQPELPIAITGIEAQMSGTADASTGVIESTLRLVDEHGLLVSAGARLEADAERLIAEPARFVEELRTRPIVVSARIDGRRLEALPSFVRPQGPTGVLSAEATLRGTLQTPVLSGKTSLGGFLIGPDAKPFDLCGRVQYDPSLARIGLGAEVHLATSPRTPCAGRRIAIADATGIADIPALARGERGFAGTAELALEDAPLDLVPGLGDAGAAGSVSGRVALVQGDALPQLTASLNVRDGGVGTTSLGSGKLDVRSDGRGLRATLTLEREQGKLLAEGRAVLAWEGLIPALDTQQPLVASATVDNVDAVVLAPLLRDALADVHGRLDGDFKVSLTPRPGSDHWGGDVTGKASLTDGSFQLRGLDMRLSHVNAEAEAKRIAGRTVISLRKVSAASRSDRANISAAADLYMSGLRITGGRANVNMKNVPFLIAGVSQATLTGSSSLTLEREGETMKVLVVVPELTADLPRTSGRNVLAIDQHPDIEIIQPLYEPVAKRSGEAIVWELAFDLGRKVRLKRADLEIPLRGDPVVTLGEKVAVTGDLELEPGGRIKLIGKSFTIESGEVHFDTDDPSNPHLRVLSSWRAPDATIVYIEVRGTFREASLRLESDPPRSQQEIHALLLGGGAAEGGDAQSAGLSYGTDFLGEVLSETPLRDVQLRASNETTVDEQTYTAYTATLQISDELWFDASYKSLESAGPGDQRATGVSGTLDWRFHKNWSLRTEVGNIGTGLDLLWQYRY